MGRGSRQGRPWQVAAVVLALYGVWIAAFLGAGHQARDFVKIGPVWVLRGHGSSVIRFDPHYRYPANHEGPQGMGNDGQWSYFIALDPRHARAYLDNPPYRYSRILYPMLARAVSLGRPAAVPWALLIVNWLAVGAGTLALATWLARRRASPWPALVFGLFAGLLLGVQRDLTEPLAYSLAAVGVLLADRRGASRWAGAGVFALAGLARQTTLVFPVVMALWWIAHGDRRRDAALFAFIAVAPFVAWSGFLWSWLGRLDNGPGLAPFPFVGLAQSSPWQLSRQGPEILCIVVPALIAAAAALRRPRSCESWLLAANVLLFVLLLPADVFDRYTGSSRAATGAVLAGVMAAPGIARQGPGARRALLAAAALVLVMTPVIAVYGFTSARIT